MVRFTNTYFVENSFVKYKYIICILQHCLLHMLPFTFSFNFIYFV